LNDEVPKSFALVVGHVCGVIAVGMVALSAFAVWTFLQKPSAPLFVVTLIGTGMAGLFLRWAGALTGFWDTRGRLSVSKLVYSGLGVLLLAAILLQVTLAFAALPKSLADASLLVVGGSSGVALVYLCYLAYHRFK
jgi:hypothetical protein